MEVKLLHLYGDIMNLYGEYANVKILEQHLIDQGIDVTVDKKSIGEDKNFEEYDFVYMGSGTEKNQQVILQDILKDKEQFIKAIENGTTMLLTGNSFEILGEKIDDKKSIGLLNFTTEHVKNRITTDIICNSEKFENKVVGFVNTMSKINENDTPLFNIEWNNSNLQGTEGVIYKNIIGTHLIGPLLIRNPEILRYIIKKICERKDEKFEYKNIEYKDETLGYELVLKELENRKEVK